MNPNDNDGRPTSPAPSSIDVHRTKAEMLPRNHHVTPSLSPTPMHHNYHDRRRTFRPPSIDVSCMQAADVHHYHHDNRPSSPSPALSYLPSASMQSGGIWTTGLFDCCDDSENCYFTYLCPCSTFGRITEMRSAGVIPHANAAGLYCAFSCLGTGWLYAAANRSQLRQLLSLPEVPWSDWCVHCFFGPCALCQEFRELSNRGIDPYQGWQGNIERWQSEGLLPPDTGPKMVR